MRHITLGAALALLLAAAPAAVPAAPTEISFARFFGSCEADYGTVTDPSNATGECGIITALVNKFNATNREQIVVRTQVVEHGSYYSQLGARIVGRDVPAVAILHSSALNDFVKRGLIAPLDDEFRTAGVDTKDFTPQAETAVTVDGHHYALPFDTHSWLWHVNLNLMRRAGLVKADGKPLLPQSPQQLLEQARRFKAATGKPYFIWLTNNDPAFFTRTLLSMLGQQGASLFPQDDFHIDLHSPAVRETVKLLKTLYEEGLTTRGNDYGAALQGFAAGEGGVMVNGTWIIGDLLRQARRADSATAKGYTAVPFPQLYGSSAMWADNHVMVLLKGGTADARSRHAAVSFLKFLYDEGGVWARTGQLPTRRSVIESPSFRQLPLRSEIATISRDGVALPIEVARQAIVGKMLGDALTAAIVFGAEVDKTLSQAETSINRMLKRDAQFQGGAAVAAAPPVPHGALLDDVYTSYPRLIRQTHHSDAALNGRLVASMTATEDGQPAAAIYASEDQGKSFKRIGAIVDPEFAKGPKGRCCGGLYELPVRIGALPAGTLLYSLSVGESRLGVPMENRIYRSDDGGRNWSYLSLCGTGRIPKNQQTSGIWEPEFAIAKSGELVCYYSDETLAGHSQVLVRVTSRDGVKWSAPKVIVAGDDPKARPGMPIVRQLPNGSYLMSYENCYLGPLDCALRIKRSPDGLDWGAPNDPGMRPETASGQFFRHAPTFTWMPVAGKPDGMVVAIGQILVDRNGRPEPRGNGKTMFVNDSPDVSGPWRAVPSPIALQKPVVLSNGCQNYSTPLLPSADGKSLAMLQSDGAENPTCRTRFGSAAIAAP
ncbi:extracellular solute-binding protein [Duganella sp. CT11-25]|uniref:extracellular solute-binding protein n=1 Tax=unclassified Duganella TaxID=2636909 RepID=UPI0039AF2150